MISARPVSSIVSSLSQQLQLLGFCGFSYEGVPYRMASDLSAPAGTRLFRFQHVASANTSIHSSPTGARQLQQYLRQYAKSCPNFRRVIRFNESFIHTPPRSYTSKTAPALGYENGVRSVSTWPMKAFCSEYWGGLYTLFSPMSPDSLHDHIRQIRPKLHHILSMHHFELMSNHRSKFNPYLRLGVFSDNALQVLRATAEGHSSKQISTQLDISERGVDYHIDQMRVKLHARNRLHLIKIACQLGMAETD